ncbi:unnamed protein product [Rhizoctonia solani]|uniref:Peptidase S8/S53 domain-containing protein n=1 Tax=Rhizoctonia solani TaxID=456999 RepID=A0A8H3BM08_9AGAM|nr:unnamed protein product [Rhizoctonia solani]
MEDIYLVLLTEECDRSTHMQWFHAQERRYLSTEVRCELIYEYQVIKGYSAYLTGTALQEVKDQASVREVVEDTTIHPDGNSDNADKKSQGVEAETYIKLFQGTDNGEGSVPPRINTQRDATWGLQRISQRGPLPSGSHPKDLDFTYRWESPVGTDLVDVYVLDTGVYLEHQDLQPRAIRGKNFTKDPDGDRRGHGTHVAAIIAGSQFGVAKLANIIDVKVIGNQDDGQSSDVLAGIDWAYREFQSKGNRSVVNLSAGGPFNKCLNLAFESAVQKGLHICVSAGNDHQDASCRSPASAQGVIAAAASTINDETNWRSNYGPFVGIYAPGKWIMSAGIRSPSESVINSGTSMSSAYVSGFVAYILGRLGEPIAPGKMLTILKELAVPNALSGVPADTT